MKVINAKVDYKNNCVNCLISIMIEVDDFIYFSVAFVFFFCLNSDKVKIMKWHMQTVLQSVQGLAELFSHF